MTDTPKHSASVVKFYPKDAAKDADNVLEQALGVYEDVLVLGWNKEGYMEARVTLSLRDGGELLWLLEHLKHRLMSEAYLPPEMQD